MCWEIVFHWRFISQRCFKASPGVSTDTLLLTAAFSPVGSAAKNAQAGLLTFTLGARLSSPDGKQTGGWP
jgi:hypothetical protein